jgi:hypothetical protein
MSEQEQAKRLDQIGPHEWALYQWHETTPPGETVRQFARGSTRTPDEAATAAILYRQWVINWQAWREVQNEQT